MAIDDPFVMSKIASGVCGSVAALLTFFRLWKRRQRLWADDACAAFALINLCIQTVGVFLRPLPESLSRTSRVADYYLMAFTFYTVVWFSRLSILFSIIRIHPSSSGQRRLFYIAITFFAATIFFMTQLLWTCEPMARQRTPSWKDEASPQCPLPRSVPICQLVTDVFADAILMFYPLRLFKDLLDRGLRMKLGIIFSTCVVTTVVSLVHATYIITHAQTKEVTSAIVEGCISLIVANIPVVVSALIPLSPERDYIPTHSSFRIHHTRGLIRTFDTDVDSPTDSNDTSTKPEEIPS
ncbi:hypothetical protein VKT23_000402 [Stygiomarasmius scandens]|uniref:Rhodopsin domain-containing protein n=1 Tax=Marasmiellus scandens TaxID=2682957 RepID=A0ABR1K579_9AGAR